MGDELTGLAVKPARARGQKRRAASAPHAAAGGITSWGWEVQKGRSPVWTAKPDGKRCKPEGARPGTGLDAQLAQQAEHDVAVSGQRPDMPLH
jgi:hypothetical protein